MHYLSLRQQEQKCADIADMFALFLNNILSDGALKDGGKITKVSDKVTEVLEWQSLCRLLHDYANGVFRQGQIIAMKNHPALAGEINLAHTAEQQPLALLHVA